MSEMVGIQTGYYKDMSETPPKITKTHHGDFLVIFLQPSRTRGAK
jgi:hypothetical protein